LNLLFLILVGASVAISPLTVFGCFRIDQMEKKSFEILNKSKDSRFKGGDSYYEEKLRIAIQQIKTVSPMEKCSPFLIVGSDKLKEWGMSQSGLIFRSSRLSKQFFMWCLYVAYRHNEWTIASRLIAVEQIAQKPCFLILICCAVLKIKKLLNIMSLLFCKATDCKTEVFWTGKNWH